MHAETQARTHNPLLLLLLPNQCVCVWPLHTMQRQQHGQHPPLPSCGCPAYD
jgi:hypothetical protein